MFSEGSTWNRQWMIPYQMGMQNLFTFDGFIHNLERWSHLQPLTEIKNEN